ncbi:tctex1 domain-containing protein 4 [Meleagris gallopavo]|nr:tctex1 domain-containing protein 4 [Meleagris gallopavo]
MQAAGNKELRCHGEFQRHIATLLAPGAQQAATQRKGGFWAAEGQVGIEDSGGLEERLLAQGKGLRNSSPLQTAYMAEQPSPELAPSMRVTAADGTEAPHPRTIPRGSHPTAPARGPEEGKAPQLLSRRSSMLSILPGPPGSRRSSLGAAPGGKRPSVGPWLLHSRVSFSGLPLFQPIPETHLENTYRMRPEEGCRFNAGRVQRVLERALARVLGGTAYSPQGSTVLVQSLAELLRGQVKEVVPPRYKLVCHVLLGQHSQQSMLVASQALWDPESDSFASASFCNASLFAVATVHGVYFE